MPRRKLTEEEKKERRERMRAKAEKERRESVLAGELERAKEEFYKRQQPLGDPTRTFKVGDRVVFGSHDFTEVEAVEDGMFYLIRVWGVRDVYTTKNVPYETHHWVSWQDILPFDENWRDRPILSHRDDVHLTYMQQDIRSLIGYHDRGIDYTPEYQRGVAWTLTQRIALIDSVFKNVDIGKFTLIERGYLPEGPMMEVLDGKQRLQTLVGFYEDRFQYLGRYYSELHPRDRGHFKGYHVNVSMTERMTEEQKLRYFLRLNTTGSPQDPKHLAKVERMWRAAVAMKEHK